MANLTEDMLAQKLKDLRQRFNEELSVLERALLKAHKNLQADIDKHKLAAVTKSLHKNQ